MKLTCRIMLLVAIFIGCRWQTILCQTEVEFDPGLASISVKVRNLVIPYKEFALYVLPGETLELEVYQVPQASLYSLLARDGIAAVTNPGRWNWKAPDQSGVYVVSILNEAGDLQLSLNMFVMVPFHRLKGEMLNGYRIGRYPEPAYRQLPIYEKPAGFIEITQQNENTAISPHFQIKQFPSKQLSGYPKYLVLQERLLLKLELVLAKANEQGHAASTFVIMSGYRTPYYNQLIGNVRYSRHVWGGAADIFIDEHPKDWIMDDLNGDGVFNQLDAGVLYEIIDSLYGQPFYEHFIGGLGGYNQTRNHGPFVHVDVRGFKARWGLQKK